MIRGRVRARVKGAKDAKGFLLGFGSCNGWA